MEVSATISGFGKGNHASQFCLPELKLHRAFFPLTVLFAADFCEQGARRDVSWILHVISQVAKPVVVVTRAECAGK